jgi:hypothetical protein
MKSEYMLSVTCQNPACTNMYVTTVHSDPGRSSTWKPRNCWIGRSAIVICRK